MSILDHFFTKHDPPKRKRRIMRRFSIDEISAVDSPAQEGAKFVMMKRAKPIAEEESPEEKHFGALLGHFAFQAEGRGEVTRKLAVLFDNAKRAGGHPRDAFASAWRQLTDVEKDRIRAEEVDEHRRRIADEVTERRRNLAATKSFSPIEDFSMNAENIVETFAKAINAGKSTGMSEAQFTKLAIARAQALGMDLETYLDVYPEVSQAIGELGGFKIAKAQQWDRQCVELAGKQLYGDSDEYAGVDALAKLDAKAADLRKSQPKLSKAAAFTAVYTDPDNAGLVAAERAQHRPY